MNETWRYIKDSKGYMVSNLGNVLTPRGKLMTLTKTPKGYLTAHVRYKDDKGRSNRVHRLVAQAFLSNDNCYDSVNHIDCNKTNNNVTNLEWCSSAMNSRHARQNDLGPTKLSRHDVIAIRKLHRTISNREIARRFGISHTNVNSIVNGVTWSNVQ
jgi:hypothetical protein